MLKLSANAKAANVFLGGLGWNFQFFGNGAFCLSLHIQRNEAVGTSVIQDGDSVGLDYNLNGFSLVIISMVQGINLLSP